MLFIDLAFAEKGEGPNEVFFRVKTQSRPNQPLQDFDRGSACTGTGEDSKRLPLLPWTDEKRAEQSRNCDGKRARKSEGGGGRLPSVERRRFDERRETLSVSFFSSSPILLSARGAREAQGEGRIEAVPTLEERERGSERGSKERKASDCFLLLTFSFFAEEGGEEESKLLVAKHERRTSPSEGERERRAKQTSSELEPLSRGKNFLSFSLDLASSSSQSFQPSPLPLPSLPPPRHPSHAVHALHFGVHAVSRARETPCRRAVGDRARAHAEVGGSKEEVIERAESRKRQLRSRLFPVSLSSAPRARSTSATFQLPLHASRSALPCPSRACGFRPSRESASGGKAAPFPGTHLVVTRSRRHGNGRRIEKRSFSFSSPSLLLPTFNSAVAPRRGSLVVVANSKKTDIKKQGLNSIKVRDE